VNGQNYPYVKKNNFFFQKKVLPEIFQKKVLPESFRKNLLPEEQIVFYRKNLFPEAFRKNLLPESFRKKVLPESFQKKFLPDEQFVLPEEGSSGWTICSTGRRNYFFNTRTILSIHLITGCTSNVAGAPSMSLNHILPGHALSNGQNAPVRVLGSWIPNGPSLTLTENKENCLLHLQYFSLHLFKLLEHLFWNVKSHCITVFSEGKFLRKDYSEM